MRSDSSRAIPVSAARLSLRLLLLLRPARS